MKSNDKTKQLEIELDKTKYAGNPDKLQNAFKELNKIRVVNKNLNETRNEILLDYTGEFEMDGKSSIGDQIGETHIRFRNITDYENFINAIEEE